MTAGTAGRLPLRLFLAGTLSSRIGDTADLVALNWYVVEQTGSATALATVNVVRLAPILLFTAPAGWLADRYDKRRLLAGLRVALFVSTLCLAWIVTAGGPLWLVCAMVFARASAGSAEPVLRQTLLPSLRGQRPLTAVIAMHSACLNGAMILGPAVGALVLAVSSVRTAFWFNAFCTLVALCCLTVLPEHDPAPTASGPSPPAESVWRLLRQNPAMRRQIALAMGPMLFAFPYTAMMPLLSKDLFDGDGSTAALLLTCGAAGALAASTTMSRRPPANPARLAAIGAVLLGFALLVLLVPSGFTGKPAAIGAGATMVVVGLVGQCYRTANRAALQATAPGNLLGRIMGIASTDRAMIPVGTAVLGPIAELAGTRTMLAFMGLGCVVTTLLTIRIYRSPPRPEPGLATG
ncbi:MFS transporter [Amycolatopsis circi]|uniref:MFS transporter n=1 Tax=Amycolatopsis circi TaxID=871959 RepID=UPI000E24F8BE|nr:MFS transporter [Amycolatopsis circi]